MRMIKFLVLTAAIASPLILQAQRAQPSELDDSQVFEMAPFVVYEGLIDVVDGFTGEPYNEANAVLDGFRESFNKILLWYHRKLLKEEYEFINYQLKFGEDYAKDLNALSDTFNISEIDFDKDTTMKRERAIFSRLMKDPFFKIEALIVWDLDRLRRSSRGTTCGAGKVPLQAVALCSRFRKLNKWI